MEKDTRVCAWTGLEWLRGRNRSYCGVCWGGRRRSGRFCSRCLSIFTEYIYIHIVSIATAIGFWRRPRCFRRIAIPTITIIVISIRF